MTEFLNGRDRICVRPAVLSDTGRIAELYRSVAVTAANYRTVTATGDASFMKRGGMFEISTPLQIRQRLNDPAQTVVMGEYNGAPNGMLWYGLSRPDTFAGLIPDTENSRLAEELARRRGDGTLGYSQEIISVERRSHIMPYALFYAMMKDYAARGVTATVGEVFRLDGVQDETGFHPVNFLNRASYSFLVACGGRFLGTTGQKTVQMDGFTAYITPHVMWWDTARSQETIRQLLQQKGWETV